MKNKSVICDRCGIVVDGAASTETSIGTVYTSGFYDLSKGYWARFAKNEETIICDHCMHSDPTYRKIYDPHFRD